MALEVLLLEENFGTEYGKKNEKRRANASKWRRELSWCVKQMGGNKSG